MLCKPKVLSYKITLTVYDRNLFILSRFYAPHCNIRLQRSKNWVSILKACDWADVRCYEIFFVQTCYWTHPWLGTRVSQSTKKLQEIEFWHDLLDCCMGKNCKTHHLNNCNILCLCDWWILLLNLLKSSDRPKSDYAIVQGVSK